jgi:hypothetical protein
MPAFYPCKYGILPPFWVNESCFEFGNKSGLNTIFGAVFFSGTYYKIKSIVVSEHTKYDEIVCPRMIIAVKVIFIPIYLCLAVHHGRETLSLILDWVGSMRRSITCRG